MKRQSGITLVGFVVILIIAAFFAYTLMKLVPAYMDYFSVSKALDTVASNVNSSSGGTSLAEIQRQLDTQELSQYFSDSDIAQDNLSVVKKSGGGRALQLKYDKRIHWLYNIDFLMHFEKAVPLKAAVQ